MSSPVCEWCDRVERGPWETDPCPTALFRRDEWLRQADLAVYVLEHAEGPLSIYDIQRGVLREMGWKPHRASLNASVANDPRCCWAGRGLYALYRHGFIPGPRCLADVAKVILLTQGCALGTDELAFVMSYLGYRFQKQSLINALSRDPSVEWVSWRSVGLNGTSLTREVKQSLQVAPTMIEVEGVIERIRQSVSAAKAERGVRLGKTPRGLSEGVPIYVNGSQPPGEPWNWPNGIK